MFFARIWSLILICYIKQGILVIKFGCQIPRNDLQKDKIGLSPAPIARFYISITANSFLIWMELDLSFSHPLSREMSSFLPLSDPSLISPSGCRQTIRPIFPKTKTTSKTKISQPECHQTNRPITSGPLGFYNSQPWNVLCSNKPVSTTLPPPPMRKK